MSGLIWIQSVWNSDGIPEGFFEKVILKITSRRQKKNMKNFAAYKELIFLIEGHLCFSGHC